MSRERPHLLADATGVWREDMPGQRFGFLWEEIYAVSGHKLDDMTRIHAVVVLGHENGHFLELYPDCPGFEQVASRMTDRLMGIAPDWLEQVEQLDTDAPPLQVWQRT
jgi:hypothetical protein